MYYVVAGSYEQAKYWARKEGIHPEDWTYVSTSHQLQGLRRGTTIEFVENYQQNKGLRLIYQVCETRDLHISRH